MGLEILLVDMRSKLLVGEPTMVLSIGKLLTVGTRIGARRATSVSSVEIPELMIKWSDQASIRNGRKRRQKPQKQALLSFNCFNEKQSVMRVYLHPITLVAIKNLQSSYEQHARNGDKMDTASLALHLPRNG